MCFLGNVFLTRVSSVKKSSVECKPSTKALCNHVFKTSVLGVLTTGFTMKVLTPKYGACSTNQGLC